AISNADSSHHRLQLLHPLPNLPLQRGQFGEELLRWDVLDLLVHNLLVAVEAQVIPISYNVSLEHTEALRGTRALALSPVPLLPPRQHVRQIVLPVPLSAERLRWHGAELVLGQERLAFVVEAPAVGIYVVEPHVVSPAGVCLGEQQDSCGDTGVGLERTAGQRDDGVELLLLDE